jgi:ferredoxin
MAMRVHVSRNCGAHGQCNWINPEIFPLDDDGYSAVKDQLVPDGGEDDARRAAAACPAAAISIAATLPPTAGAVAAFYRGNGAGVIRAR